MKRDFLTLQDLSTAKIIDLIDLALKIKKRGRIKINALRGKIIALIFEKPSTRTRVSFEVAIKSLGGDSIYLETRQLQLSRGETIADTARVLSKYVDAIIARVYRHESLEEMAKNSEIPIINGLSDKFHPVQVLSDLVTIKEKFKRLRGIKLAFIGDGNNICNSLLIGCSKVGVNISVATPESYAPDEKIIKIALENARKSNSLVEVLNDPLDAVKGADIIYTDTFVSMGMEMEREKRLKAFLPKYQVNRELMESTGKKTIFMHCLPAHRGEEVTSDVIDGPFSIVWDQAENRLYTQEALLLELFGREVI
ncbi:ornithine carbamoyltransferase [Candidatus Geothermarchaeota archaeon]|nr:MAG: ornithine carbamoyltransferase [Candidatus Geothermarchaeota archaeon]